MPFRGIVEFARERVQIVRLGGRRPFDADARALRKFGMHDHDGAPVTVEKRVRIGEIPHDLARFIRHGGLVLADVQSMRSGKFCVVGMGEEDRAFGDRETRRGLRAVLSRPRIHVAEKSFMRVENVAIGKMFDARKTLERFVDALHERAVFEMPNDFEVFFSKQISQITARLEVVERIERHGFASRK